MLTLWRVKFSVGSMWEILVARATTSYKACINIMLSSKKLYLRLVQNMVDVHGVITVVAGCTYRSSREATQNHIVRRKMILT